MGLNLSVKRIFTNESRIAEKTQSYLENKYKEKFVINKVQPITPQGEVYSSVSPESLSTVNFSAVYIKKESGQIVYGDNYMLLKWRKEAQSLINPLIVNTISSNTFVEVSLPEGDLLDYGDITLPLKELSKKYPKLVLISVDVFYLMDKGEEAQFNQEILLLVEQLQKTNINNIWFSVRMYDRAYFGDINRFRGIAEEDITGIRNSRRAQLKEIYAKLDDPGSLSEIQTKLMKTE
jgi:hypothetical protein